MRALLLSPTKRSALPSGEQASSEAQASISESSQSTQLHPGFGPPWSGTPRSHGRCPQRHGVGGAAAPSHDLHPSLVGQGAAGESPAARPGEKVPCCLLLPAPACPGTGLRWLERAGGTAVPASVSFPPSRWTSSGLTLLNCTEMELHHGIALCWHFLPEKLRPPKTPLGSSFAAGGCSAGHPQQPHGQIPVTPVAPARGTGRGRLRWLQCAQESG